MDRCYGRVDRTKPGLVASGAEKQAGGLQDDGNNGIEDGHCDGQAHHHGQHMAAASLEKVLDLLWSREQADEIRRAEQDRRQRNKFSGDGDDQRPQNDLADVALGVVRLFTEICGGSIAIVGKQRHGGGSQDDAGCSRNQLVGGGVEQLRRGEQAGKRPFHMGKAQ